MPLRLHDLLLGLLACCPLLLWAQPTITGSDYFPRPDDSLFTAIDNLPAAIELGAAGGSRHWDFTTLQSPFPRRRAVKAAADGPGGLPFSGADLWLPFMADNAGGYYNITDNRFELVGYYGQDPLGLGLQVAARFSRPYVERWSPLKFLDFHDMRAALVYPIAADDLPPGFLGDLPITPDSVRLRIAVDRSDLVDAWGTLAVPGGVYNVLREKRTELRDIRLDAKVGFLPWIDITDIALAGLPIEGLGRDTLVRYYFWSEEAHEPIAVVTTNRGGLRVLSVEYKASSDVVSRAQDVTQLRPGIYAVPNPAIVNVRFEFSNLPPDQYELRIYNLLGQDILARSLSLSGSHTEKVDISRLGRGVYLYSLINSSGRVLSTQRLVVIRP